LKRVSATPLVELAEAKLRGRAAGAEAAGHACDCVEELEQREVKLREDQHRERIVPVISRTAFTICTQVVASMPPKIT
jgi:hypothetical protein